MTMSIAGRCEATGMLGVAIASSSISVGSRCAWAQAGVGVVLTQNVTNPALGGLGLELLAKGYSVESALEQLLLTDGYPAYRQLLLLDQEGNTAHHSGENALGIHNHAVGEGCIAAGNLLANPTIPTVMVHAFVTARGTLLPIRLLAALQAALVAGGEQGALQSAALVVVDRLSWPTVDLRVDWHDAPITALHHLWERYAPQWQDYVTRAQNPAIAPSYGVPGDP